MKNASQIMDTTLMATGTIFGLANIEHILGVVLLIIQIAWFMTKLILASYKSIKEGESLDEHDDEVDEFIDTLNGIKNDIADKRAENEEQLKNEEQNGGE